MKSATQSSPVVTFTRQRNLRGYRGRFGLPYTVLADESRDVNRAYRLGRGPSGAGASGAGASRAPRHCAPTGASCAAALGSAARPGTRLQLGGDFVVGRHGRLVYVYRSTGPADRPPVDDLVAAVRGAYLHRDLAQATARAFSKHGMQRV
jgi:hypothetical protein